MKLIVEMFSYFKFKKNETIYTCSATLNTALTHEID